MLLMFTFKKLSFFHSSSLPVTGIFDPFKENIKPRLPPRHKTGKAKKTFFYHQLSKCKPGIKKLLLKVLLCRGSVVFQIPFTQLLVPTRYNTLGMLK